jgi:hypothetical protein
VQTKELIRRLQEADPSGELEVTVGKTDIYFLQVIPSYYDGHCQILKRDPVLEGNCYNIVGAEIRSKGQHVCIETHSISEMLADEPDLPVTYDGTAAEARNKRRVEEWRATGRRFRDEVKPQSN